MNSLTLSNSEARRIFLDRHALSETPQGPATGVALLDLIQRLGFVQLDSINTVARAHDLILFARRPGYRPKNLQRLYEKDRGLFEHWTHDAAVIPMAFYPHWHLRFQRDADLLKSRWQNWRRDGFEARVWIVSPTTCMATLNTMRAILKDARMREQAGAIRKTLKMLHRDVEMVVERVGKLDTHFRQARDDLTVEGVTGDLGPVGGGAGQAHHDEDQGRDQGQQAGGGDGHAQGSQNSRFDTIGKAAGKR